MVRQKKQVVVASSSSEDGSSDSSVAKVTNAFAALDNESSSEEETSSSDEETSSTSEESSSEEEDDESSSAEESSSEEDSSSDESTTSSSSGFFSDASSEIDTTRWVTIEESSEEEEEEGLISKEKKDRAQIIREKWLKKKDEVQEDVDLDDSGEEFSGRLRWMKRDYRERFLREHGLSDLIKSKESGKKKKERKDVGPKKKEVKFNETVQVKQDEKWTSDNVMIKFYDCLEPKNRGPEFLPNLQQLLQIAQKKHEKLKILLTLVNAKFDYAGSLPSVENEEDQNVIQLRFHFWKEACDHINDIFTILENNPNIIVHEMYELVPEDEAFKDDSVLYENEFKLKGSIVGIVERIDEEFTKLLSNIDQSDMTSYQMVYQDEYLVISLLTRATHIYKRQQASINSTENAGVVRLTMRLVDKLYYRPSSANDLVFKMLKITEPSAFSFLVNECKFLIQQQDQKIAAKANLLLLYHLAINHHFDQAYTYFTLFSFDDLLVDVDIFVLYNRTLCQIALCAFQLGKYECVVALLQEFVQSRNIKTLLGQTSDAFVDVKNTVVLDEFESTEKRRALVWHLHIPDDLVECALLLSMMLVELPWLAIAWKYNNETPDGYFKELYVEFIKHLANQPPEQSKDYVFLITQCLLNGNWQEGLDIATTLPIYGCLEQEAQEIMLW